MQKNIFSVLFVLILTFSFSQKDWNAQTDSTYSIDYQSFIQSILEKNKSIYLPLPAGGFVPFRFEEASVLPKNLSEKYQIFNYNGLCHLDNQTTATLSIFKNKIYASVKFKDKIATINPAGDGLYLVKWFENNTTQNHICNTANDTINHQVESNAFRIAAAPTQIKNYTIAIAATGEYTAFHGGTVADALAAISTTLNRVNSIYRAELGINLVLHPETDLLIYTNGQTDPFDSSSSSIMNISKAVFDSKLEANTYDIGHVFCTIGGLADIGVVCTRFKTHGVTGTSKPIGDFYDVDFVAHELGHQFGANHTFNGLQGSCAGNMTSSRFEIGSGSTIMGYAGICGLDNLQNHSDPYFHIKSIQEIRQYITAQSGKNCGYFDLESNQAPEIISKTASGYYIPIATPFKLEGIATDLENDSLSYNWEQYDLGTSSQLNNPSANGPLFRSFLPTKSGIRYFPMLNSIVSQTNSKGEILPTNTRKLTFSFNARDAKGNVSNQLMYLNTTQNAGPFVVTFPANNSQFEFGQEIDVLWNVANTNASPVNCQSVKILLSTDNGITFSTVLNPNTANDGTEKVMIPAVQSQNCKLMVMAADNVFFQLNTGKFAIIPPTNSIYFLKTKLDKNVICTSNDEIILTLEADVYTGFKDSIQFNISSNDAMIEFLPFSGKFHPSDKKTIVIRKSIIDSNQKTMLTIETNSLGINRREQKELFFYKNALPTIATVLSPISGATAISMKPTFKWEKEDFVNYQIELSDKNGFDFLSDTLDENQFFSPLLKEFTNYFWKIKSISSCGTSQTEEFSFMTDTDTCISYPATDLPLNLPDDQTEFTSFLTIPDDGILTELKILNLKGSHDWTSDLDFSLISPNGEQFNLFADVCEGGSGKNFNLNLEDNSSLNYPICPPIGGFSYRPINSFQPLIGTKIKGNWALKIVDNFPESDIGVLNSWTLQTCVDRKSFNITGIENPVKSSYYLFPNPTKDKVEIANYQGKLLIYNSLGTIISEQDVHSALDVSILAAGIYFLKLENEQVLKLCME
jgi:hypothetical protein